MLDETAATISIVMPMYNAAPYLREAIHSILSQTIPDWELVIIDDCSSDNSAEIAAGFKDERIRLFSFPAKKGISEALNYGISLSKSEFVGRMDADDICVANRFETQLRFLASHPEIALVGSALKTFPTPEVAWTSPEEHRDIRLEMMFRNPFYHPTVIFRRAAFESLAEGYRPEFEPAEDFDLWERMSRNFQVANMPDILLHYRRHTDQVSFAEPNKMLLATVDVRKRAAEYLDLPLPPAQGLFPAMVWLLTFWVQALRQSPGLHLVSLRRGVRYLECLRRSPR